MPSQLPFDLEDDMIRKSIENLRPYQVVQIENAVKLDANENANNLNLTIDCSTVNRYPDNDALKLKKAIEYKTLFVCCSKGIETNSLKLPSEIVNSIFPKNKIAYLYRAKTQPYQHPHN